MATTVFDLPRPVRQGGNGTRQARPVTGAGGWRTKAALEAAPERSTAAPWRGHSMNGQAVISDMVHLKQRPEFWRRENSAWFRFLVSESGFGPKYCGKPLKPLPSMSVLEALRQEATLGGVCSHCQIGTERDLWVVSCRRRLRRGLCPGRMA